MTISNDKMTSKEAKSLLNYVGPITYLNTSHNRNAMKSALDTFLLTLRPKA